MGCSPLNLGRIFRITINKNTSRELLLDMKKLLFSEHAYVATSEYNNSKTIGSYLF